MCAIDVPEPFLIREADLEKPIILPTTAGYIWEKFEYFDRMTHEYPNCVNYEEMERKLLALWWEQFQKEVKNETTK